MMPSRISGWPRRARLASDAQVARERELAAAAERVAADRGDHRARDRRDRVERAAERVGRSRARRVLAAELADVGAGRERLLAARDHHRLHRRVGRERGRGVAQRVEQRDRQRVHRRAVEAQHATPPSWCSVSTSRRSSGADATGARGTAPRRPTGTKPAASVERIDAALPGATCAHNGSPAGTRPPRPRDEPAAEPAPARAGVDLVADLPTAAEPAPEHAARCLASSVHDAAAIDAVARRLVDARVLEVVVAVQPRRARPVPSPNVTSSASSVAGSQPSRSASQLSAGAEIGTREIARRASRVATSSASMSAASTKWPVNPTSASHGRPGDGTTSTHAVDRRERAVRGVVEHPRERVRAHASVASSASTAVYGSRRARGDRRRPAPRTAALGHTAPPREQLLHHERAQLRREPRARRRVGDRTVGLEELPVRLRSASHSSATPSPSVATVRTIGGRHVALARELEHPAEVAHGRVGARRGRPCSPRRCRRSRAAPPSRPAPRRPSPGSRPRPWCRRGPRSRPRPGRRRRSRRSPTACRPRRARAPPAASRPRARRDARASPSSG